MGNCRKPVMTVVCGSLPYDDIGGPNLQIEHTMKTTFIIMPGWAHNMWPGIFLEWLFLTLGPVEQVPGEPWHLPITNETEVLILSFIWLFLIVSVYIIFKRISKELPQATPLERTFLFFIFLVIIINMKFQVYACDIRSGSPGILFPSADPEPGMPQGAPGHEIEPPIPPPAARPAANKRSRAFHRAAAALSNLLSGSSPDNGLGGIRRPIRKGRSNREKYRSRFGLRWLSSRSNPGSDKRNKGDPLYASYKGAPSIGANP
jgi:hypothetical protein